MKIDKWAKKLLVFNRELKKTFTVSRVMVILSILMLIGLIFFLAGPKIINNDLIKTHEYEFKLSFRENKTMDIPLSPEQEVYLIIANNLILRNSILVEINSSCPLNIYRVDENITVKLAEHVMIYNIILNNVSPKTELIMENEDCDNASIRANLTSFLTVKVADFTVPHMGFLIFVIILFTLQFLSLVIKRDTLIGVTLNSLVPKRPRESIYWIRNHFLETIVPLIFLSIVIYEIIIHERILSLAGPIYGYIVDFFFKLSLIPMTTCFFFATIFITLNIIFDFIKYRILKMKDQKFLKVYEEIYKSKSYKTEIIIIVIFSGILLYTVAEMMFVYSPEIILVVSLCYLIVLYSLLYYLHINWLHKKLQRQCSSELIAGIIEMDARFLGFWILGFITLFIMFEVMRPAFLWLTYSLLFSSYYPHFLYESAQTFTT
jgi:hypothetical protein